MKIVGFPQEYFTPNFNTDSNLLLPNRNPVSNSKFNSPLTPNIAMACEFRVLRRVKREELVTGGRGGDYLFASLLSFPPRLFLGRC